MAHAFSSASCDGWMVAKGGKTASLISLEPGQGRLKQLDLADRAELFSSYGAI